jgi:hypothetical protein
MPDRVGSSWPTNAGRAGNEKNLNRGAAGAKLFAVDVELTAGFAPWRHSWLVCLPSSHPSIALKADSSGPVIAGTGFSTRREPGKFLPLVARERTSWGVNPSTCDQLFGTSGLPPLNAPTTRAPGTCSGSPGWLSRRVSWMLCEPSSLMMPTRRSAATRGARTKR